MIRSGLAVTAAGMVALGTAGAVEAHTWAAGLRQISYRDQHTGTAGQLALFYPTGADEARIRRGPMRLSVALDADPVAGSFPAVVLSHGSGASMLSHHGLAAHLARHGWVVAAPMHVGNNFQDHSAEGTPRMWRSRPRQVSAALDALLADPRLGKQVDRRRIGAIGYSAGADSVLVAAGAVMDLTRFAPHCQAHPEDAELCRLVAEAPAALTAGDPRVSVPRDRRIRALVLMAPVGMLFADGGLDGVKLPVRIYKAEKDEVLRSEVHVDRLRALLPRKPEVVVVPGAGHYAFVSPFAPEMAAEVGPPAQDPPGFDRAAFQRRLQREVLAFLQRALEPSAAQRPNPAETSNASPQRAR